MQSKIEYMYFIIIFQPNKIIYIFFNLDVHSVRSALEMLMCLMSVLVVWLYFAGCGGGLVVNA